MFISSQVKPSFFLSIKLKEMGDKKRGRDEKGKGEREGKKSQKYNQD